MSASKHGRARVVICRFIHALSQRNSVFRLCRSHAYAVNATVIRRPAHVTRLLRRAVVVVVAVVRPSPTFRNERRREMFPIEIVNGHAAWITPCRNRVGTTVVDSRARGPSSPELKNGLAFHTAERFKKTSKRTAFPPHRRRLYGGPMPPSPRNGIPTIYTFLSRRTNLKDLRRIIFARPDFNDPPRGRYSLRSRSPLGNILFEHCKRRSVFHCPRSFFQLSAVRMTSADVFSV